jgi:dTDP-4-amino-4,6-dideoxygalactose transaminase/ribosomal protein S18 acetylase RimI-like enzyme
MIIRQMEADDVHGVVKTHLDAFAKFFLSFLGPRFLRQFYAAIVNDQAGVAMVAMENGDVIGFAAGTTEPTGFYRRFLRRRFAAVSVSLVVPLVRRPSTMIAVTRRALRRTRGTEVPPGAELMSLAVADSHQNKGVGSALLKSFIDAVRNAGMRGVWLVTDAADNERVNRFYETAGFQRTRSFTNSEGRQLHEYTRSVEAKSIFIPFARPDIGEEEIDAVRAVLESGWLTTGERVHQFEEEFAAAVGAKHAIALNSGTAALHLALDAIGLQAGDEVIIPDYTFTATAEVVLYFGAKPVIVDVDRRTLNIDPAALEKAVTPRTKAVIPVHFGGLAADLDAINTIAKSHRLAVVEDAAHAFPARYRGRSIGSNGDVTCFSFYATKTITTGEGGMFCTNSDEHAERARLMSLHGISRDAWKRYRAEGSWFYEVIAAGYKYNMTDIAAAIGLKQLAKAERMRMRRQSIAERYNARIRESDLLELPACDSPSDHAWHLYALRLNLERLTIDRDRFIEELRSAGVGASVHFIPLHLHPFYRQKFGFSETDFPISFSEYRREVSLPIYSLMSDHEIETVIRTVFQIASRFRA